MATDNPQQRSVHLDDETLAMLDAYADKIGIKRSPALRVIIRQVCSGQFQPISLLTDAPTSTEELAKIITAEQRPAPQPGTTSPLPDPRQETFKVPERFKEASRAQPPRPAHAEDDDF